MNKKILFSILTLLLQGKGYTNDRFDIPELNMNYGQLDKLFMGAESSGGGRYVDETPMRNRQISPRNLNNDDEVMSCKATLLLDSDQKIKYILKQDASATIDSNYISLYPSSWDYYVFSSDDSSQTLYSVPMAPSIGINNYSLEFIEHEKTISFTLCEAIATGIDTTKACIKGKSNKDSKTLKASLYGEIDLTEEFLKVKKTLTIHCTF